MVSVCDYTVFLPYPTHTYCRLSKLPVVTWETSRVSNISKQKISFEFHVTALAD